VGWGRENKIPSFVCVFIDSAARTHRCCCCWQFNYVRLASVPLLFTWAAEEMELSNGNAASKGRKKKKMKIGKWRLFFFFFLQQQLDPFGWWLKSILSSLVTSIGIIIPGNVALHLDRSMLALASMPLPRRRRGKCNVKRKWNFCLWSVGFICAWLEDDWR